MNLVLAPVESSSMTQIGTERVNRRNHALPLCEGVSKVQAKANLKMTQCQLSSRLSNETLRKVQQSIARIARSEPAPHVQRWIKDMVARYPELALIDGDT